MKNWDLKLSIKMYFVDDSGAYFTSTETFEALKATTSSSTTTTTTYHNICLESSDFNMEINFIRNYINTWKHIFWLHNSKYITKWYCEYLTEFPPRLLFSWQRKESWLMSLASPENEQFSNVFIPFWIPLALVSWMYGWKFIALYMNFNKQFSNEWIRKFSSV